MPTGVVKWWSDDKGFGFITPDGGGYDLFVHHTSVLGDGYRSLREGQRVQFEEEPGPKGPKAVGVVPALSGGGRETDSGVAGEPAEQVWPAILGPDGRALGSDSPYLSAMVTDVRSVATSLVEKLSANPKLVYSLTSREFEEVVAELLTRRGYEVTLTPATRDGGLDIYAAKQLDVGSFLYLVECKKYAPDQKVGVGLIRELLGVVAQQRATAGILATTSFFTKDAQEFQREVRWQLSLKDFADIASWLRGRSR